MKTRFKLLASTLVVALNSAIPARTHAPKPPAPKAAAASDYARPIQSARFRLVLSSFTVEHQTADEVLDRDGRGDEIFVRGDWYDFRNFGNLRAHSSVRSGVFGAKTDFHAGSGAPGLTAADDQRGGLVTGDRYPPSGDNFEAQPASRRGDLPMILWEGTLWPGDAVLVVPSIWEWDKIGVSVAEAAWTNGLYAQANRLQLGSVRRASEYKAVPTFPNDGIVSVDLVGPLPIYGDGNRPIGAGAHPGNGRRGTGNTKVTAIVLSYEKAIRFALQVSMFHGGGSEYPGPAGGFVLRMTDPASLRGNYTLYLRLERMD